MVDHNSAILSAEISSQLDQPALVMRFTGVESQLHVFIGKPSCLNRTWLEGTHLLLLNEEDPPGMIRAFIKASFSLLD